MKTAHAEPGTTIHYGEHVFEFGDDGQRQVTEEEESVLADYAENGGSAKVEIGKARSTKSEKGGDA